MIKREMIIVNVRATARSFVLRDRVAVWLLKGFGLIGEESSEDDECPPFVFQSKTS